MRLISFDVGIKNMAYCILDISQNVVLREWNVLDLCNTAPIPKCNHTLKNGKTCNNNAKYVKSNVYNCEKHAKISKDYEIPKKEYTIQSLKKIKMETLRERCVTVNIGFENKKKEELLKLLDDYYKNKCWELVNLNKKDAGKVDLVSIGRSLYEQMKSNKNINDATHVIIENQISPIANRMKTIQGMLAQYFIHYDCSHIEFVSSGNKLKHFETQSNAKSAYQQHKKDSVFYCKQILEKDYDRKWLELLSMSSKKDDLADCFLQALWWIKRNLSNQPSSSLEVNGETD